MDKVFVSLYLMKKGIKLSVSIWIRELSSSLDANVDEKTKKAIMGACGEKCHSPICRNLSC